MLQATTYRLEGDFRESSWLIRCSKPLGEWNTFGIEVIGRDVKVRLNGELVSHLAGDQTRPLKGHIGLQNHHPGSRVQFRNLFVKKMGAAIAASRTR